MIQRSRVVTPAVLVLFLSSAALGVRGAVRGIAEPFEGIERLTSADSAPDPEPPEFVVPDLEMAIEAPPVPEGETGTMATLINDAPAMSTWEQWKSQAIAALPEELRRDSDYRRVIDHFYRLAVGESLDDFSVDIISRPPPAGGYDIVEVGFEVGFTDIDEQTAAKDSWVALWDEWRAREIASLPEAWRNDPNRLAAIDTTYKENVNLQGGGVTRQLVYLNNIRLEVNFMSDQQVTKEYFGTEVDR